MVYNGYTFFHGDITSNTKATKGEVGMADFVTLACPSCGGRLQVSNDIDRFACGFCGQEHIVKRAGGIVSLAPVLEAISGVKQGVDRTASELAIGRLEKEIEILGKQRMEILKNRPAPIVNLWAGVFLSLGILSFCGSLTLLPQAGKDSIGAIVFGLILLGLGSFIIFIRYQENKSKKIKIERGLAPIDQSLNEKQRDLAKHRNFVTMR